MTKSDVIHFAAMGWKGDNVYDLGYYRARVKHISNYKPSRPVGKGLKTDRERAREEQLRNGNYKDLKE